MPQYRVSLSDFSGPLDLILHLVRRAEMDIFDLDVSRITEDYLAFIESEGIHDLEEAYHFLAMAASLVELKSRMLLPRQDDEVSRDVDDLLDPRDDLSRKLAVFESIQDTVGELASRYEQAGRHWPRQIAEQMETEIVYSIDSLSIYDLMATFSDVLSRPRFKQITIFREDFDIDEARSWLRSRIGTEPLLMEDLLMEHHDIYSVIVTFIALLDMIRGEELSFSGDKTGILVARTATSDLI